MARPVFGSAANACLGQEERCVRRGKVRSCGRRQASGCVCKAEEELELECCAEADWFWGLLPPSLAVLAKSPPLDQDDCLGELGSRLFHPYLFSLPQAMRCRAEGRGFGGKLMAADSLLKEKRNVLWMLCRA